MSGASVGFQDCFSSVSQAYRRYRPRYPVELFQWLASCAPGRDLAWDVGTGSGQCAVDLAGFFERVIATDASEKQIAQAIQAGGVEYRVSLAHESGLPAACVDLVTVAQAVQWFDLDAFYAEVRRVGRPGGLIAVWCYSMARITPDVDAVLYSVENETLKPFWPAVIGYVSEGYRNLPFPFVEIQPPQQFIATAEWTLDNLLGHISSMSATARFREAHGFDPIESVRDRFAAAWGEPAVTQRVTWPLHVRAGRV